MKKRFIAFVLSVMLVLPLSACIGIGDGALFGNSALNSPYRFTLHRSDGSVLCNGGIRPNAGAELYAFLAEGEYRDISLDNNSTKEYTYFYELSLETDEGAGTYRVYGNWYVYKKTESGFTYLGLLNQSFERVREAIYGEEYIKYRNSADYNTDVIMMVTNIAKEYTVADFPEVDCIYAKCYVHDKTNNAIVIITIDSATDEELWASVEKLQAREDISSAELSYYGYSD